MARGKYTARSQRRHDTAADEEIRTLRSQLKNEQTARLTAERRVGQIPVLEAHVAHLETQIELHTSDLLERERKALEQERGRAHQQLAELAQIFSRMSDHQGKASFEDHARLVDIFGKNWIQPYSRNREGRRTTTSGKRVKAKLTALTEGIPVE